MQKDIIKIIETNNEFEKYFRAKEIIKIYTFKIKL